MLQQYLPFTVLKQFSRGTLKKEDMLQQYLPFTVLKQNVIKTYPLQRKVATVLTVYGIETTGNLPSPAVNLRCNSTYRLRY